VIVVVALVLLGGAGYGLYAYMAAQKKSKAAEVPRVKVGFMMAQTGGAASTIKGVQLAVKQLGADNTELVQVDSMREPKVAPDAIKKLIDQKVVAIIGEGCSSASLAALPLANEAKIPLISPSASSTKLSIADDYFFRTIPPDDFQASYLAKYAYEQGIRRVGEFYTDEPAGAGQARIFKDTFTKLGGQIVAETYADAHIIDLAFQTKTLKAANPEMVLMTPNSVTSAIALIKLLRADGYTGKFYGSDANYDKTLISETGKGSEGQIVSTFTLGTRAFKQAMTNEYQSAELAYAAPQAYDALHAILLATRKGAKTEMSAQSSVKYSLLQVRDGISLKSTTSAERELAGG
jgi:branched-chain amino acid transport system substrate-binding protein